VNLARVESRGVDLDIVADLPRLAQDFLDDVVAWRRPVVPDIAPTDSIGTVTGETEPDSTQ
jgi:hypothetical protein